MLFVQEERDEPNPQPYLLLVRPKVCFSGQRLTEWRIFC